MLDKKEFLNQIKTFLKIKRRPAELVLRLIEIKLNKKHGEGISQEEVEIYNEIKRFNYSRKPRKWGIIEEFLGTEGKMH